MLRIGHSWDTHKLVKDRPLYLGGIKIESELGLLGHSDADCLLHALAEALLGSLALGDLGSIFPDNDPKTLNMDSKIILKECYQMVKNKGYYLNNCDLMIYSENIKIAPYRIKMQEQIAKLLDVDLNKVSIKATTYEKMSFIGRGEAIACEAVVLVTNGK